MPANGVVRSFSVRSLVPAPDLTGARRGAEERVHPAVQARLRRKYRTFEPEIVLSSDVPMSFGTVNVSGRLDGLRRTSDGIVLYEIKPVPMPAKRWLHHPSLQRARWQLQLYLDLARHTHDGLKKDAEAIGGILYLVDPSGKSAEESVDLPPPGFLQRRVETVLSEADAAEKWGATSLAVLNEFICHDAKDDRPLQQKAWKELGEHDPQVPALLSLPPGAGKTRVALRYALRQAITQHVPLFWVTTKSRGRNEVLAELRRYSHAGFPLRILWKTAAARLCECDHSELCPKRERTLEHRFLYGSTYWRALTTWNPDDIAAYSAEHELCGHELARQLEPVADVIIADLNYFLDASSLHERTAVCVFDEVQNLPDRILQFSRVQLSRGELITAIRSLPASARHRYRSLHSPEFLDEVEPDVAVEHWVNFAAELRLTPNDDARRKVERIATLRERYLDNYTVHWYHGPEGPGWAGTLLRPDVVMDEMFSRQNVLLALSGFLSFSQRNASCLFPGLERFELIGPQVESHPPVAVVPLLDFSHPISLEDHVEATEVLRIVREHYGRTIAVFGQNRASNLILAMRLHVRGHLSLLDTDLSEDWSAALDSAPDFLFISLGGNLSEAVNPPPDLFSCGVVLAPGFRPPDIFDFLQRATFREDNEPQNHLSKSVSHVVQAAGRLQRSPQGLKPVLLINKSFARPEFLKSFPRDWYSRYPEELLFDNLSDAQTYLSRVHHAN
jgi:hypothetical protein